MDLTSVAMLAAAWALLCVAAWLTGGWTSTGRIGLETALTYLAPVLLLTFASIAVLAAR